jgi:pimeloyl-ACP methyl ester carboxylesterase
MAISTMPVRSFNRNDYSYMKEINGIDIYYEFYENPQAKKTLFFLHGFLASGFCYRSVIPDLNKKYQIVNVDFPPYGNSGKSLKFTFSFKNIAKTLIELIKELQLKNVVLVGHSMGGQIGLYMIREKSDIFEKAVLLASSGYLRQVKKPLIMLSYFPFAHQLVKRRLVKSGGVVGNLKNVVHDEKKITQEMIDGYLEPYIKNDEIFHALAKFVRDREGDLTQEDLQKIETPCLLVWGEFDKIVPVGVGKRLHKDLPHSKLVILKNTGHLIPEEEPDQTVQLIEEFINDKW